MTHPCIIRDQILNADVQIWKAIPENIRSIFETSASSRMMQGCLIAGDAPPLSKTLILKGFLSALF
jgi:hypothetical protein